MFEGVPQAEVSANLIDGDGLAVMDVLASTGFLKSNGEARRALKENSISVNKEKVTEAKSITTVDIICDRYVLLQRGKKNYFLLVVTPS